MSPLSDLQDSTHNCQLNNSYLLQAMRDKEASVGRRKYKYCLVRIRFPDGFILQGTFSVYEPISAVQDYVTENLENQLPFLLLDSVTGAKFSTEETSLLVSSFNRI